MAESPREERRGSRSPEEEYRGFTLLLVVVALVVTVALAWFRAYRPSCGPAVGQFTARPLTPIAKDQ